MTAGLENNASIIPLIILVVPILYAFFNIVISYISSVRYRKLHQESIEHEWLLQQKNNSLVILQRCIKTPLEHIKETIEDLYKNDVLSTENRKRLLDAVAVSRSRIENLSTELQRSTLSITKESVDIVPFYRSATTLMIIATTAFILLVTNSVLASTDAVQLSISLIVLQLFAYVIAMVTVVITSRYRRMSERLLTHSKATIRLQQEVDDAKDHIISLVVKIISADIDKLQSDVALLVDEPNQQAIKGPLAMILAVIARLELMSNIESRLIKSDVKLLNVEELIEEIFREHQPALNQRGIQVEHFHRVGATKIQLGIVQDRTLLKTALTEVFMNAILHAPEQSIVKIVSEHSLTASSITVTDQGPGEQFEHTPIDAEGAPDFTEPPKLGVGLYIADQIMHILGGELHIQNKKGAGSSVRLTFINNYVR